MKKQDKNITKYKDFLNSKKFNSVNNSNNKGIYFHENDLPNRNLNQQYTYSYCNNGENNFQYNPRLLIGDAPKNNNNTNYFSNNNIRDYTFGINNNHKPPYSSSSLKNINNYNNSNPFLNQNKNSFPSFNNSHKISPEKNLNINNNYSDNRINNPINSPTSKRNRNYKSKTTPIEIENIKEFLEQNDPNRKEKLLTSPNELNSKNVHRNKIRNKLLKANSNNTHKSSSSNINLPTKESLKKTKTKNKSEPNIFKSSNGGYSSFFSPSDFKKNDTDKEIAHIMNSYDFIGKNDPDINKHFRDLLLLVKELKNENDYLTRELRTKDKLINTLEKKLDNKLKKNDDLHKSLITERNKNVQVENEQLKSKIKKLEDQLNEQQTFYESVVNEHQDKLKKIMGLNERNQKDLNSITGKFNKTNDKMENIQDELWKTTYMKSRLEDENGKLEKVNEEQRKRIELLEDNLRVILTRLKDLFQNENNFFFPLRRKLLYGLSLIVNGEEGNQNNQNIEETDN